MLELNPGTKVSSVCSYFDQVEASIAGSKGQSRYSVQRTTRGMDCESLSLMGEKKPEMERLPGVSDQSQGPKETPLKRSKGWLGLQAERR